MIEALLHRFSSLRTIQRRLMACWECSALLRVIRGEQKRDETGKTEKGRRSGSRWERDISARQRRDRNEQRGRKLIFLGLSRLNDSRKLWRRHKSDSRSSPTHGEPRVHTPLLAWSKNIFQPAKQNFYLSRHGWWYWVENMNHYFPILPRCLKFPVNSVSCAKSKAPSLHNRAPHASEEKLLKLLGDILLRTNLKSTNLFLKTLLHKRNSRIILWNWVTVVDWCKKETDPILQSQVIRMLVPAYLHPTWIWRKKWAYFTVICLKLCRLMFSDVSMY